MLRFRNFRPNQGGLPANTTPEMQSTLALHQNLAKRKKCIKWGTINVLLFGLMLYNISYQCPLHTTWFNICEDILCVIFALNIFYHFCRYIFFSCHTETVTLTADQKKLLGLKDNDPYCTVTDKTTSTSTPNLSPIMMKTPDTSLNTTPLNWTANSWRDSPANDSHNYSLASPSWVYRRGSPDPKTKSPKVAQQFTDTSGVDFIDDENTLDKYLKSYDNYEKTLNSSAPSKYEQTVNLLSTFWTHPAAHHPNEISLKKNLHYQLAPHETSSTSTTPGKSDEKRLSLSVSSLGSEIWRKLQIDPHTLIQWNANLRMWISQTILERLTNEIQAVNDEFSKLHLNDVRIGSVGLDRLRKTAQTMPVAQYIPTLTALIPFLELTPNQEYLIKRIKELSKGGCMSEFKWNAGGNYNGKIWDDSLVNDSEIIIHLLATYLDSQLLPLPNQPDSKPFSKEHLIRPTEKVPKDPSTLAINQVSDKPPHFRLIVGEEIIEVAKGHNNLFYTVLLFLYYVNKKEYGMLGKVNMGRSGVNMLWIIEGI